MDFLDYYMDVHAVMPFEKEEFFSENIIRVWGVTSSEDYVSPERIKELEEIVYEKVR